MLPRDCFASLAMTVPVWSVRGAERRSNADPTMQLDQKPLCPSRFCPSRARPEKDQWGDIRCPIALRCDLGPIEGSPAGMTRVKADGLPILDGRKSSRKNATRNQHVMSYANSARATPIS